MTAEVRLKHRVLVGTLTTSSGIWELEREATKSYNLVLSKNIMKKIYQKVIP